MHPRTQVTLDELGQVEWFRNVGVQDTSAVEILSSWYAAIESCSSTDWENVCLEASNQYCERLVERSPKRFEKWNEIVVAIKPVSQALVREKTRKVIEGHHLPKTFLDAVNWDILHLCMEAEYTDVYPPGFYAASAYWYINGHFPCGWHGEFPNGKLIVY